MKNYDPGNGTPFGMWILLIPVALITAALFVLNHVWPIIVIVLVGWWLGYLASIVYHSSRVFMGEIHRYPKQADTIHIIPLWEYFDWSSASFFRTFIWALPMMGLAYLGLNVVVSPNHLTVPLIVECGSSSMGADMSDNCRELSKVR